jgi:DNA gyrase subunit A
VRLIRTIEGENVVALARIEEIEEDDTLLLDEDGNVIEPEVSEAAVEGEQTPEASDAESTDESVDEADDE